MLVIILLTITILLSVQSVVLFRLLPQPNKIDNIVYCFVLFMFFDASSMLVFTQLLDGLAYVSTAAPFGLVYGPLLYCLYCQTKEKKITYRRAIVHFIPFIIAVFFYLIYLLFPAFQVTCGFYYYIILYTVMCVEWIVYPLIILTNKDRQLLINLGLFKYSMSLLLILTSFMLPFVWYNYTRGIVNTEWWTGVVLVSVMLFSMCLAYGYLLDKLRSKYTVVPQTADIDVEASTVENKTLTNSIVEEDHEAKISSENIDLIDDYLKFEKYFDSNFKLEQMLKDLHISKTVVAHYFSLKYPDGFVKTINKWRVEKACQLLEDPELNDSMDEVAYSCGFNSRASFYRNFNQLMGCSPMAYRARL